jgi:iron complex outermembrane receptor protein
VARHSAITPITIIIGGVAMRPRVRNQWGCATAAIAMLGTAVAAAKPTLDNLTDLSLEELSNIEITSVSKRGERLSDAPTSVYVITGDDIRRAGATSLPEALRLAPNLQVARASANGWAISARGFNGSSANKLLVLIDGRSVYSPLFSGVFWDVQDLVLADIDRIEVISGPGGTLWGVNAVNGVVNVITRSSADTRERLLVAGAGDREAQLAFRQGGSMADGSLRIYAKANKRQHTETADGSFVDDASHTAQLGFRADWSQALDKITLQGDAYAGKRNQPLPGSLRLTGVDFALGTISVSGANLVSRWERRLADDASISAQLSVDHIERDVPPTFSDKLDIVDLQVQHAWRPSPAHALVWGAQYRMAFDHVVNGTSFLAFLPARVDQAWASVFAQDEITLGPTLRLTAGARIERNDYTGAEFLPNLRLAWKPSTSQLLWGAASRTVRAPSRLDRDIFVPAQPPFLLVGGPDFRSEVANVYELGYRGQPTSDSSLSVTLFHADYDRLHTQEYDPSRKIVFFGNEMKGTVRGLEMWGSVQASPAWRLRGGFSRLLQELQLKPGSIDTANSLASAEGANPSRQWMLRSSHDLPHQMEVDATLRYVSALPFPPVPSYLTLDLRWAWRPQPGLELSITGQNLLGPAHGEFTAESTRTAIARSVFVELVSRF